MRTRLLLIGSLLFIPLINASCSGEQTTEYDSPSVQEESNKDDSTKSTLDEELNKNFQALEDELIEPVWQRKSDGKYFTIELPKQMHPEDSLNLDASLQYAYMERIGKEVKENYIIVLVDDKEGLTKEMQGADIEKYNEKAVDNLLKGKVNHEKLNEKKVIKIQDNPAIINELKAGIQMMDGRVVDVYYTLGVVEGKKAFYQILSWTTWGQRDYFKVDMNRMIKSFREK